MIKEAIEKIVDKQDLTFEEAYEKCTFYLSNDSIREKVAKSGQEKVFQLFDYKTAVSKITELAFG